MVTTRIAVKESAADAPRLVRDLMQPAPAVLPPGLSVADAVERLRQVAQAHAFTYAYVVEGERLVGVLVMRDLLFATPGMGIDALMIREPFWLDAELSVQEAMTKVLDRHYPVYPVCDAQGRLLGAVRGDTLFRSQAIEISAQMGNTVGVSGERVTDRIWRGLVSRHGWLQINLITAFVAGAVVGVFESTISAVVVLAAFLPVLAGQAGNTGCQSLAVVLRGLTLGDITAGLAGRILLRETLLGLINGLLVGLVAAAAMWWYAAQQAQGPTPLAMAACVLVAMTASCALSGLSGAAVPLLLRRLGCDPATASSIFVTTCTDVSSLFLFLGLARAFLVPG